MIISFYIYTVYIYISALLMVRMHVQVVECYIYVLLNADHIKYPLRDRGPNLYNISPPLPVSVYITSASLSITYHLSFSPSFPFLFPSLFPFYTSLSSLPHSLHLLFYVRTCQSPPPYPQRLLDYTQTSSTKSRAQRREKNVA